MMNVRSSSASAAVLGILILTAGCALRRDVPLSHRARNARTPAEHAAVAAAYRERAARLRAEAAEHQELAAWWSSLAGGRTPATGTGRYEEAEHCRRLADNLLAAAKEADALAAAHGALEGEGGEGAR